MNTKLSWYDERISNYIHNDLIDPYSAEVQ